MQDYNNLIQQLKARKEELSLTQAEIAYKMQIDRVRVNELLSSRKTNMTVKTLIKLCNALNVTINFQNTKSEIKKGM